MIQQYKHRPLNIYRASAGSGKTHLLTGFYIKLLFVTDLLPATHSGEMHFSEILAVTFTNKATAEMKTRIIQELYTLSTEPQTSHYLEDLLQAYPSLQPDEALPRIMHKATQLLVHILNEYSSFNISTIDSFFQKIVRSFARELNISGNYEVQLDAARVLDAAVSSFLDSLDERQDAAMFRWMVDFSSKRSEEGSGWDLRKALLELVSKVLVSETYRQHSQAIHRFTTDKEALGQYVKMLRDIQSQWRTTLLQLGEAGRALLCSEGLSPADFKYSGLGSVVLFDQWANGEEAEVKSRFINAVANLDVILKKTTRVSETFRSELQQLMSRCVDHLTGQPSVHYYTASAIMEHFYELGILANIDRHVIELCNEQNCMLLSSTTEFLSRLIEQDDAPFIYEKTGTRIHSYMIDEFQDTSGMQWGNFMPLVSNALSEQYQNLIVGDVKQSIYRWRGGDWNLLNSEINSYEPYLHYDDSSALTVNWRSLPAIVDFNNRFFTQLAPRLDEMLGQETHRIEAIYADVSQSLPNSRQGDDKPQGLVRLTLLTPTDQDGVEIDRPVKANFLAEAAQRLPEVIIELQDHGYEARDIAVLCRRNRECQWAAEAILRYRQEHPECKAVLDIISSEALRVSSRPVIQVIIALMRHLLNPESDIQCALARTGLYQLEGFTPDEALERFFALPEKERPFSQQLVHRPLYEMSELLIDCLPAEARRGEAPFLQAFRDMVLEFSSSHGADLSGFIDWWDQTGVTRSIATPEGQNALQILSVHKSKGLGMPVIIMPFASWGLDIDTSHNEILWCEPHDEPFALDVLLPLKLDKKLAKTIFAAEYNEERERAVIDNLNTAYVAFTRAKEVMVLMTPRPAKESHNLESYLADYIHDATDGNTLTLGSWQGLPLNAEKKKKQQEEKLQRDEEMLLGEKSEPVNEQCQPTASDEAATLPTLSLLHDPAKPDVTAKQRGTYIHAVMQEIRCAADAPAVISRLYGKGEVDADIISQHEMEDVVCRLLELPQVAAWFCPGLQVLCELSLIDENGKMSRADRVVINGQGDVAVIDYKTGSSSSTSSRSYREQVARYMGLLRSSGFRSVRGYLLYFKDGAVVEVEA